MCIFSKPKVPKLPDPVKPPAESKTPEYETYSARNRDQVARASAGSTMITGPMGASTPAAQIGRSTLLGQ